jgi:flagellin-like hook-associated protein FlgL
LSVHCPPDPCDDAAAALAEAAAALAEAKEAFNDAKGVFNDAEGVFNNAQNNLDDAEEAFNYAKVAHDEFHASDPPPWDRPFPCGIDELSVHCDPWDPLQPLIDAVNVAQADLDNAIIALDDAQTVLAEAIDARRYTSLNGDTFTVNDPDSSSKTFQIGADNDINSQISFSMVNATAAGLSIDGTHLLDIDSARNSITSLDFSIDQINSERSRLGSLQNKLQFTMSNLTSQTQSIEAARSSIQDTDFAADAADLAKNQILAQSATAMLAQASAIPQNILSLIAA